MVPPSSHAYRFPACLRHVFGFPELGLLRKLRPLTRPFPVVRGELGLRARAAGQGSRVPASDLRPLGSMLYPWRSRAWGRKENLTPDPSSGPPVQNIKPDRFSSRLAPSSIQPFGSVVLLNSEASSACFVALP